MNSLLNGLCLLLPLNNILSAVLGLICILLFVILVVKRKINLIKENLLRFIIWGIFCLWICANTVFAYDRSVALLGLLDYLPFVLFGFMVSHLGKTVEQQEQIAQNLIVGIIPVSLFGLFQVIFNRPDLQLPRLFSSYVIPLGKSPDGRILSLFGHFNELGMFIVMILPLMIYKIVMKKDDSRWVSVIALPIGLLVLYFSGSRNAWAVATIGMMIMAIYYRFWLGLIALVTLGLSLVSAVWLPFASGLRIFFPASLIERLLSTFDPQKTDFFSTASRWHAWQVAIDLIAQRPIVGWGLRNFTIVAQAQQQELFGLPHTHNLYLSIAVGAGLPGLVLFLTGIFYAVKTKDEQHPLRFMFQCSLGLFLLSSLIDITLYEPRISLLFWLLVGILTA